MAVQVDDRAKKKRRRKVDDMIDWSETDEEIRHGYNKRVENSEKPSMWQYDAKGGVPTELANLDSSTFLTSRLGQVLCFLPKDILARICSMLSVSDFFHLSLACRFLHWRMFTFCTCYVPRSVRMVVHDDRLKFNRKIPAHWGYTVKNGVIRYQTRNGRKAVIHPELDGQHLFVYQPFCLHKPFFFDTLILNLHLPSYCNKFYNSCLSYIMDIRCLARELRLLFFNHSSKNGLDNYSDTNDFLEAINATYYSCIGGYNIDIYMNCPYARRMYRVFCDNRKGRIQLPHFQNSIGCYDCPLDSAVKATLKNFLANDNNLIFHQYLQIERNNGRYPLIEHLFEEFGEFEESLCEEWGKIYGRGYAMPYHIYYPIWKKIVATENGGQIRIVIKKVHSNDVRIKIGKEEMFNEIDKKYMGQPHKRKIWQMETAIEPNESEQRGEVEQSDEDEDQESAEEEQEAFDVSLCLCNRCSIQ